MLSLTVKTGEAIAIGKLAYVKVVDKSGQRVRLIVATPHSNQVRIVPPGIVPPKFDRGLTRKGTGLKQLLLPFA